MSYDANVLRRATQRLEEERRARSDRAARLRQEAYEKEPRLAQLDKKLQGTMSQLMAAALRRGESTAQAIRAIRAQNQEIQKERGRELLGEFQRKFDLVRWGIWYQMTYDYTNYSTLKENMLPCHEYYPIPDKEVVYSGGALDNKAYNEYGM